MKLDTPRIGRRVATTVVAVAGILTALVLDACVHAPAGPRPRASTTGAPSAAVTVGHGTPALVTRVVDGDTVEVRYRGRDLTVRLIGVDTPETVAPGQPVECGGPAASRFTEQQLDGERVRIEFDVSGSIRTGERSRTCGSAAGSSTARSWPAVSRRSRPTRRT